MIIGIIVYITANNWRRDESGKPRIWPYYGFETIFSDYEKKGPDLWYSDLNFSSLNYFLFKIQSEVDSEGGDGDRWYGIFLAL